MAGLPTCANCGSSHGSVERHGEVVCQDCDWPVGRPVSGEHELCSICRRRHGTDVTHAAE